MTVDGTHAAYGDVHKPCGFRLVKEATPAETVAENGASAPGLAPAPPPPLSQIGIVPSGVVEVVSASSPLSSSRGDSSGATIRSSSNVKSGGTVDVSKLGPSNSAPLFNVRMVMPVPPDSEVDGVATLTGLEASTMFHNHSPGLEVMKNGL